MFHFAVVYLRRVPRAILKVFSGRASGLQKYRTRAEGSEKQKEPRPRDRRAARAGPRPAAVETQVDAGTAQPRADGKPFDPMAHQIVLTIVEGKTFQRKAVQAMIDAASHGRS